MPDKLILFMYQSWADLDRAVGGLTAAEATTRRHSGSSIAWTVGHITQQVDSWINVRFQGLSPHPVISQPSFHTGGSGDAEDWPSIRDGTREVRAAARRLLDAEPGPDLDRMVPYDGAIAYLRETGLSLRYALMAIAAHHFEHIGEILTIRSLWGHVLEAGPTDWGRDLL